MKNFLLSVLAVLFSMTVMAEDANLSKCYGTVTDVGWGTNTQGENMVGSQFYEKELVSYVGGSIKTVRVYIGSLQNLTDLRLFVKKLITDDDNLALVKVDSPKEGWNEVTLDTPVEITAGMSIAIGYYYNALAALCAPISFTTLEKSEGGLFITLGGQVTDLSGQYGNLCVEATVSGISLDHSSAGLISMNLPSDCCLVGDQGEAVVKYRNMGKELSSVTIRTTSGGKTLDTVVEKTMQFNTVNEATVKFETVDEFSSNAEVTAAIVAIDGEPFESGSLSASYSAFNKLYDRTVVIEEGTGTWCGWCIRGIVAMEQMHEKYPDSFIGIAVHASDEMALSGYLSTLGISGLPGCTVDRLPGMRNMSVSPESFEEYYQTERARRTYVDFDFQAAITSNKKIEGKTTCTFDYDETGSDIRLCYVVIEDGVTGYNQSNYYAGGGSGEMGGYENKPSTITDIKFNDVARATYPTVKGGKLQLGDGIVKGQEYTHQFSYIVPTKVQNSDNLSLAALMIDGKTGAILQAHKIKLTKEDGIESTSAVVHNEKWYTIDGTLLDAAPSRPGLYINNGKKIIIK